MPVIAEWLTLVQDGASGYVIVTLEADSFALWTEGARVFIRGGSARGTLYGAYAFLEESLGCRWYTPEVSCVPQAGTMKIDARLDNRQTPSFALRRVYAMGANARYNAVKRNNVPIWTSDAAYGGGLNWTWSTI